MERGKGLRPRDSTALSLVTSIESSDRNEIGSNEWIVVCSWMEKEDGNAQTSAPTTEKKKSSRKRNKAKLENGGGRNGGEVASIVTKPKNSENEFAKLSYVRMIIALHFSLWVFPGLLNHVL